MLILLLENRLEFLRQKYLPLLIAGLTSDDPANLPKRPRKRPFIANKIPIRMVRDEETGLTSTNDAEIADRTFDIIEAHDPSPNKIYTEWTLQRFLMGDFPLEDVERLKDAFGLHMRMKLHRLLPPSEADILKFPTVRAFLDTMQSKYKEDEHGIISDPAYEKEMEAQSTVLLDDAKFTVLAPKTKDAACWFGRATGWCTVWGSKFARAADQTKGNHYESYARQGQLYIIFDKAKNTRYQFHFETRQFMDVNDRSINMEGFWQENPELFYKFVEWRGLGKVDWTELARLPLSHLVIGQMAQDRPNTIRIWPTSKAPNNPNDLQYKMSVSHHVFNSNPLAGSGTVELDNQKYIINMSGIDPLLKDTLSFLSAETEEGVNAHRHEIINWLNSFGIRSKKFGPSLALFNIFADDQQFGTREDLERELVQTDTLSWTIIPHNTYGDVFFCKLSDGRTLSRIVIGNGATQKRVHWYTGTYSGVSSFDLRHLSNCDHKVVRDLARTVPLILKEIINRGTPLTHSSMDTNVAQIFTEELYETPALLAEMYNSIGVLPSANRDKDYKEAGLLVNGDGEYTTFEQKAERDIIVVDDVSVWAVASGPNQIFRVYKDGKPVLWELHIDRAPGERLVSLGVTEYAARRKSECIQVKQPFGPVLLPILSDTLSGHTAEDVVLDEDVIELAHFAPIEDFEKLRALSKGEEAAFDTLPNLVKHGFIAEARARVTEHTGMEWYDDQLAVYKFTDLRDFIEDHGDKDAKGHLNDLDDYNDDYIEVHDSDYEYIMPDLIEYMKPEDRVKLVKYISENMDNDALEDEDIDLNDIDDVVKAGRTIDEVNTGFISAMHDVQRLAIQHDIYEHYKQALERADAFYVENGKLVAGMQWDTPYVGTLSQDVVFAALGNNRPEHSDWADILKDEYNSEPRLKLNYPYNGWSNSLDTKDMKDYAQNELMDRFDIQFE